MNACSPDGMQITTGDDYIFRAKNSNGNFVEIGRIVNDESDVYYDVDGDLSSYIDVDNISPVSIKQKKTHRKPDAVALNISAEAAWEGGAQVELGFVGMLKGPDKGEWGVTLGVNGLVGFEGGVTASAQFFFSSSNESLFLKDMEGLEVGAQADMAFNATSIFHGFSLFRSPIKAGSYEERWSFQNPFQYSPIYSGFSLGLTGGPLAILGTASGYAGVSGFIYKSKK